MDDLKIVEDTLDKDKTAKYDRQLRLWGAHGQLLLENCKILLLNASPVGTESLKNLVLPGIGHFTIVDGAKVVPSDLGNNFFVTINDLGQSRAKVTTDLLKELNQWVTGDYKEEDPVKLINENIDYFSNFTFVIATNIPEVPLLKLAKHLYTKNIPLLVARSYGFLGYLRLAVPEHTMIESKPDNPGEDLRLFNPFEEMQTHAHSIDLASLTNRQHKHVPYPILLLQAVKKWKAGHEDKLPNTSEEKEAFKKLVASGARKVGHANFEEAVASAFKIQSPYEVPFEVQEILDDPKTEVTKDSTDFWIIASALKEFLEKEKVLPLLGSIPDIHSDTDSYMALQLLYGNKSKDDISKVSKSVAQRLEKIGRPANSISSEIIVRTCKNVTFLKLLRLRSLEEEYSKDTAKADVIEGALEDPTDNTVWYLCLRAADRFYTKHHRFPGQDDSTVQSDLPELIQITTELLNELGIKNPVSEDHMKEMCRAGGAEMHNMGAVIGGVAAQEVIKVITHQWSPMNNTLIFNGMNSTSTTTEL